MDLYSEIILDYYKNPRNKGEIENATATAIEYNPLCGDKVRIDLLIRNGKIKDAKSIAGLLWCEKIRKGI